MIVLSPAEAAHERYRIGKAMQTGRFFPSWNRLSERERIMWGRIAAAAIKAAEQLAKRSPNP
jgi:hypothetical protein